MNEYTKEQISALMDDELEHEANAILQKLSSNDEYRQIWARYHLIGDCLRGHLPERLDLDVAAKVSQALKSEPSILAPSHNRNFVKPVMGFAIAASVAVVAILGIQQTNTSPSLARPSQTIAQQQPAPANQQLASQLAEQGNTPLIQQIPVAAPIDASSRLNRYLVNYNEYRTHAGMQGMLPYVRIISYETEVQE